MIDKTNFGETSNENIKIVKPSDYEKSELNDMFKRIQDVNIDGNTLNTLPNESLERKNVEEVEYGILMV